MRATVFVLWSKTCALVRRLWLALVHVNDPWDGGVVDVTRPAVRRMIARARVDERRERGAGVCWSYSRDRVVERRELGQETFEQKADRLTAAYRDRFPDRFAGFPRMVV